MEKIEIDNMSFDPLGKLIGLRYKSHPWHGIEIGKNAPEIITCFVEMVTADTVKYEVDKTSGYLTIDRPQKFSNLVPALYGFIPQTYSGPKVSKVSSEALKRPEIVGDNDPLDVCILTEKEITHGDILVNAIPIGGFRMIDGNEADDKIIAVLKGDALYGQYKNLTDCPPAIVNRLKHYFLTYKDMPGAERGCEIPHTYGKKEAMEIIKLAVKDYREYISTYLFGHDNKEKK